MITLPGIIDLSVRAKNIQSETRAAAANGIQAICLTPDSTHPILDKAAVVHATQQKIQEDAHCDVLLLGAMTQNLEGEQLAEIASLKKAGCIAVSDNGRPFSSWLTLKRIMEYAHSTNMTLHLTPMAPSLITQGCAHDGAIASRLGLPGIPHSAETGALAMMLELIVETQARVHFSQITCRRSVELIKEAKQRNLPITADVSINHLVLNETAIEGFNTLAHVYPPLRTESDRLALLDGVNHGAIDAITSQHRPCSNDDKLTPFPASKPGASGLDLLVPLTLSLIEKGELTQNAAFYALSEGPAKVLGIPAYPEKQVDVAMNTLTAEGMHSAAKNTPHLGLSLLLPSQ
jgi:dihydroorotase